MARFITLQQAMQAMKQLRREIVQNRENKIISHDGFVGASPSQVLQAHAQRMAEYELCDDEFPEFE